MTEQQEKYHARQEELKKQRDIAERSSDEVMASVRKRYGASQAALAALLKTDTRAVKKSFPFLFSAPKEVADAALRFMGWNTTHESVSIFNHHGEAFHYEKVREKYRWAEENGEKLRDENGRWIPVGRRSGDKWITGMGERVGHPFPIELFELVDDFGPVVVVEGEKDALNLNLYGIPAITVGAAGISWRPFLEMLAGRDVILWYDNDRAGREGMHGVTRDDGQHRPGRIDEIREVANTVIAVDWLLLDATATKKDDVTDYLLKFPHIGPDALLRKLRDSAYRPRVSRSWPEACADMEKVLTPIHSERDEQLAYMVKGVLDILKEDKENDAYGKLVRKAYDFIGKDKTKSEMVRISKLPEPKPEEEEKLKEWQEAQAKSVAILEKATGDAFMYLYFDQVFLRDVRKHVASDAVLHWYETFEQVGVSFGRYGSDYLFWCGTHYAKIEEEEFHNTVNRFFELSRINIKQRLNAPSFKEPVRKSIIDQAYYINHLREKHKKLAVINHQGGTIMIDRHGEIKHKVHDPEDGITYVLPFAYDPDAKAPLFEKFMNKVAPDKGVQAILSEYAGYLFLPGYIQKFLYLYGPGGNGKSVFMRIIESLFDEQTVSHLEVASMYDHELDSLNGKMLNISTELSSNATNKGQIETLKKIAAGEPLQVNPKNTKGYVNRQPPKLAMTGNEKLKGGGMNDGLTRRMILIPFMETIAPNEMDENLESKIIDHEMPGVLNWAIEGLLRLVQNNYKFSRSQVVDEAAEEYRVETDQIYSYIKECFAQYEGESPDDPAVVRHVHDIALIYNVKLRIPTKHLYAHYCEWAKEAGIGHVLQQRNFTSKLAEKLKTKSVDRRVKEVVVERGAMGQERDMSFVSKVSKCIEGYTIVGDIRISVGGMSMNVMDTIAQMAE